MRKAESKRGRTPRELSAEAVIAIRKSTTETRGGLAVRFGVSICDHLSRFKILVKSPFPKCLKNSRQFLSLSDGYNIASSNKVTLAAFGAAAGARCAGPHPKPLLIYSCPVQAMQLNLNAV